MTIKLITECPNTFNGITNPLNDPETLKMVYAEGYRHDPGKPALQDGYRRISETFVDDDGVNGKWVVVDKSNAEIDADAKAADLIRNGERYKWETRTILFLRRIGAIAPDATVAPPDIELQIEDRLYALSQDETRQNDYVFMVTRAATLRDQLIRTGATLQSIQWRDEAGK
jgi:hypothetical protein